MRTSPELISAPTFLLDDLCNVSTRVQFKEMPEPREAAGLYPAIDVALSMMLDR